MSLLVATECLVSNAHTLDINQSINQSIYLSRNQYTLDRTPRADATSANRCPYMTLDMEYLR